MSDQSNAIAGADQPSARRSIIFTDGASATGEVVPAADGPSPIEGRLRKAPLRVPEGYGECTGFTLFGRRIRSLLYSTDVAVIRNSNADAIFAVYPFTAHPPSRRRFSPWAEAPLFVGVGGGTTTGRRAAELAAVSEMQGAAGVVLNSPATPDMVAQVVSTVDIPWWRPSRALTRWPARRWRRRPHHQRGGRAQHRRRHPRAARGLPQPADPCHRRKNARGHRRHGRGRRQRAHLGARQHHRAPARHDGALPRARGRRGRGHRGRRCRCRRGHHRGRGRSPGRQAPS